MPTRYKILVSILALSVCTAVYFVDPATGFASWLTLALGPMMAAAVWALPETEAKEIRKGAADRRRLP